MRHTLHLGDLLVSADVRAPTPGHVELQYLDVGGDERLALFQHPNSSVRIPLPKSFTAGVFRSACGISTAAWSRIRGPVQFRMGVVSEGSEVHWLHDSSLDPRRPTGDRRWMPVEVTVSAGTDLVLETSGRRRRTAYAFAGWADPVLEWEAPPAASRPRRPQPHVLLITAEACRPTFASAPVPAADVLAADGIRCTGARTVATGGPGSNASLLTGRYPFGHGVLSEWGTLPASLPTLATELARAGYHTAFAPSRQYIGRLEHGFARVFAEVLPCLTNPNQPGDVTTRQVLRWLEAAPDDRPWFLWVTYFDAHPPYRLPAHLVRRFYDGDPRDPLRAYRTEEVRTTRSMESLLALDAALPGLREGVIDPRLVARLRDTAGVLDGTLESGPGLAAHVAALGPAVRRGLDAREFAAWLGEQVRSLQAGRVEPELVHWLDEELVPRLSEIDRESLRWLEGVVDYRYVVAQAQAGAAHVDAQVGELVTFLRKKGLYEDCTVLFCCPYVDVYGEQGLLSHHTSLSDAVVQVPLVLKPGRGFESASPVVVDGPIETIDLLPTVLDSLGLSIPDVDGTSRWAQLAAGGPISERDTFVVGPDGFEIALTNGKHKVIKSVAPRADGVTVLPAGSVRMFELFADGEVACGDDVDAGELVARLDHWLGKHQAHAAWSAV